MWSRAVLLVAVLTVAACDNFSAVQEADTIEAYEAYLAENPTTRWKLQAEGRLEDLYLIKAKQDKSLDGYDAYIKRFPQGKLMERAMAERQEFLFQWAQAENTEEAWKKFLEQYPRCEKKQREQAEKAIKMAQNLGSLTIGAVVQERVNLAEDPNGPLNGFSFDVDVTNNGTRDISYMAMAISFLGDDDVVLHRKEWPVVSRYWSIPIEEEKKQPIKAGQTVTWNWTDGNMPDGWNGQVRVVPTAIRFLDEEPPEKKK
jgi:hypothetical protein